MSNDIRVRVSVAVVQDSKILLVPHFNTDAGFVQWCIPGGRVDSGESMYHAAVREMLEETGLEVEITGLLDVSEVVLSEKPYHSITITFSGRVIAGELTPEPDHPYGRKMPQWFSAGDLQHLTCHPKKTIDRAFDLSAQGYAAGNTPGSIS